MSENVNAADSVCVKTRALSELRGLSDRELRTLTPLQKSKHGYDLSGKSFNLLAVLYPVARYNYNICYLCQCACGRPTVVPGVLLTSNKIRSCGCLRGSHGVAKTRQAALLAQPKPTTPAASFSAVSKRLQSQLQSALRSKQGRADVNAMRGYTPQELRDHVERLFQPGMSWDNYGVGGWEISRIVPACMLPIHTDEGFRAANALSNLRPVWQKDNLDRGVRHKK